jgi:hypothetical protein
MAANVVKTHRKNLDLKHLLSHLGSVSEFYNSKKLGPPSVALSVKWLAQLLFWSVLSNYFLCYRHCS